MQIVDLSLIKGIVADIMVSVINGKFCDQTRVCVQLTIFLYVLHRIHETLISMV